MKEVCKECEGEVQKVTSFTDKREIDSWGSTAKFIIEIWQCNKCKTIFEKD
jgi:uncharacterized protein with PIN domain